MKKDGTIVIKGKDITIEGSGKINVKASSDVVIKGSKVGHQLTNRHDARRATIRSRGRASRKPSTDLLRVAEAESAATAICCAHRRCVDGCVGFDLDGTAAVRRRAWPAAKSSRRGRRSPLQAIAARSRRGRALRGRRSAAPIIVGRAHRRAARGRRRRPRPRVVGPGR